MEEISKQQVTDEEGRAGAEFVGVIVESETTAIIVTSRGLKEADIVHELLHVRYPAWPEEMIRSESESLIISRDMNYQGLSRERDF